MTYPIVYLVVYVLALSLAAYYDGATQGAVKTEIDGNGKHKFITSENLVDFIAP